MIQRRQMLQGAALGAASLMMPKWAFAEELAKRQTATTTEGPFYPDKVLDSDNDLLIVNNSITPAVGQITHLGGRILGPTGEPLRNAYVEIWQVDNTASYVHTLGRQPSGSDSNFQGYGRYITDSEGRYFFRTIKPRAYTLLGIYRTAHIHFAVSRNGKRLLTTQMFVKDLPDNETDNMVKNMRKSDPAGLETIMVDFKPLKGSAMNELVANFDAVIGRTVADAEDGKLHPPAKAEDGTGALPPPRKS